MTAADMGVSAAKAAMERAGIQAEHVEESIFGNARQAGGGPNVARQISIRSGGAAGGSRIYGKYGLRFRDEVNCARVSRDSVGRGQLRAGGRDGVDVAASLLSGSPLGIPAGKSGVGGWDVSRWIFLSDGEDGDGGKPPRCWRSITRFRGKSRMNLRWRRRPGRRGRSRQVDSTMRSFR